MCTIFSLLNIQNLMAQTKFGGPFKRRNFYCLPSLMVKLFFFFSVIIGRNLRFNRMETFRFGDFVLSPFLLCWPRQFKMMVSSAKIRCLSLLRAPFEKFRSKNPHPHNSRSNGKNAKTFNMEWPSFFVKTFLWYSRRTLADPR